ncbi:MAG: hypothetical protein J7L12_02275 [Desulfurococcales archaeon]|nr:hypothetical protein [Desulfurococcales archaeon]
MPLLKKLLPSSVISVNIGYTCFLYPVLGLLYPDRVPFTASNLLAFTIVDSLWGVILALITYSVARVMRTSLIKAASISIASLWLIFWVIALLPTGSTGNPADRATILCVDGAAALITWATLSKLIKRYIHPKRRTPQNPVKNP